MMNASRRSGDLPPNFINAMRTVFNVLDRGKCGYVRFADIVTYWRQNDESVVNGVPPGFLDSLRKVTPSNGLLTFEQFCAGIRLSLAEENIQQDRLNTAANSTNYIINSRRSRESLPERSSVEKSLRYSNKL